MSSGPGDAFDLDLATATLLADGRDVQMLLRVLVTQLSEGFGDRLRVEHEGGMFKKSDRVKALDVDLGNDAFRAEVRKGAVICSVAHSSGGIRIRSEVVPMDQWLKRLLGSLQAEAAHSSTARQALENLIIGDPT